MGKLHLRIRTFLASSGLRKRGIKRLLELKEKVSKKFGFFLFFSSLYSLLSKKFVILEIGRRIPGTWMTLVYIPGHRIDDKMCMRRNNIQGLTKHIKINFPT